MSNIHDGQIKYHEIINFFCNKFNYKSYLELGLRNADDTFNRVLCEHKQSVDINPACRPTFCMSTDDYFSQLSEDVKFDIIFIDAYHERSFVERDFNNSMKHLANNGTIIMDDINPTHEFLLGQEWCGTAWEYFYELGKRTDLQIGTVIPSFTGFVRRGKQVPHQLTALVPTFDFLETNRTAITRPVNFEDLDTVINQNL
jgi:hypothetical protein